MSVARERFLRCGPLAAWGAILLYFSVTGRINAFLHPIFRPPALVAGVLLVALAVAIWWLARREEDPAHEEECCGGDTCCGGHDHVHPHGEEAAHDEECCGHDHARGPVGRILAFAVLVLPVTVAALSSTDGFSRSAILNRGIVTDAASLRAAAAARGGGEDPLGLPGEEEYEPARSAEGHLMAEVLDLVFGAEDSVIREEFEGQTVELIAQWLPAQDNNPTGSRIKLVRMFMMCCAADARPVAIFAEGADLSGLKEMQWVRAVGRIAYPMEGGRLIPLMIVERLEPSDPPEETMLY